MAPSIQPKYFYFNVKKKKCEIIFKKSRCSSYVIGDDIADATIADDL